MSKATEKIIHCNRCDKNVTIPHKCPGANHKPGHHKPGEFSIGSIGSLIEVITEIRDELFRHLPNNANTWTEEQIEDAVEIMATPLTFKVYSSSDDVRIQMKRILKINKSILNDEIEIIADDSDFINGI